MDAICEKWGRMTGIGRTNGKETIKSEMVGFYLIPCL